MNTMKKIVLSKGLVAFTLSMLAGTVGVQHAYAATWDMPAATSAITGIPFAASSTDALIVRDDALWYIEMTPQTSPLGSIDVPATQLGTVKEWFNQPVEWAEGETTIVFADDQSKSPTGHPVTVTRSINAVIYDVNTTNYNGFVVGIQQEIAVFDGLEFSTDVVFDPWTLSDPNYDFTTTWDRFKRLQTGGWNVVIRPDSSLGADPICVLTCQQNFEIAWANERDSFRDNMINDCLQDGIFDGAGAGCFVGVLVCGWVIPPMTTLKCCIGGAVIGGALNWGRCANRQANETDTVQRGNDRNLLNCLAQCGVVVK